MPLQDGYADRLHRGEKNDTRHPMAKVARIRDITLRNIIIIHFLHVSRIELKQKSTSTARLDENNYDMHSKY